MKKISFFLFAFIGIQVFSQITITKDASFGNNGSFTAEFSTSQTILNSNVIILPDNSYLAVINGNEKNYILKLKSNGTLDENFADYGKLEFSENNFMNAVMQGDKIIVYFGPKPSGNNPYQDSKIMRFDKNGALDYSFGNHGVLDEVTESTNPQSLSVLILADHSFIVSNSNSTAAKKFTSDGYLDTSFSNNGEINYAYHFPIGQSSNGKIVTCDISSLSSSIFSFYNLNSLDTSSVLNLDQHLCNQHNGLPIQDKSNHSTRTNLDGMVYSVFEYKNYPFPDFSRLIVIRNQRLDSNFNGNGFITSDNEVQFLDAGFTGNTFYTLNQKEDHKTLSAYSKTGNKLLINNSTNFELQTGDKIEVKNNYLLVNSIIEGADHHLSRIRIEKLIFSGEQLSSVESAMDTITVENPVKNFLHIANAENVKNIEIFNMEGRKILTATNSKNISTTNLPQGNFILVIKLKNGNSLSKKLIKN